ncbi:P-type ATPase (P-ATPase) Superfamily [Phytophthora infestans T30-4]|uniref:Phospholipid-transporting ATPase n=1 Tax=Phytophthora infestans (strain T30-4) TaxID=403677 RepID=D0NMD4_PHYIT|nr:P-type ATPase (P-ATPase) Superfamily [Phytophthora infestans T30-4]EEY60855.1 P-type ATPase (P-ATPase) Superfamily [Phytophthora infestans T30-4]|eukprot:XP_002899801.1 P-type ATPase (P-ATPase) Superfamily [Phytophthora infestans T30-4]
MGSNAGASSTAMAGMEPRVVFLNDNDANQQLITSKQYARNVMVTSKYTAVSFVPKTIFEFFRVVANVYFLLIAVLQLATPWSPTNRFTTAGPLLFVLLVTMVKQGSEDFKRHQADEKQNCRSCRIINTTGQTEMITWQELQVGQLVCVENHEELPADVVILATSEEEGRCFIETSNLDGETNLKRRIAVKPTAQLVGWRELQADPIPQEAVCSSAVRRLRGSVEHEQPNNQLYTFTGRILLREGDRGETAVPLGPENLLLRGCSLRSCAFVVGLVIFTGSETKLLQNSRAAPSKQSKLYRTANRCMLLIFTTMFALCLASAIAASSWSKENASRLWYLPFIKEADQVDDFIVNFFTFLILYNNLVPISLYVSLDIIKVLQANRITADSKMVYDGVYAVARTSELNEELGQIEYVFSDKTGTLTCNVMEFRKCSIGGVSYGYGTTEIGRAVAALASSEASKGSKSASSPAKAKVNPLVNVPSGVRLDIDATDDVRDRISSATPVLPVTEIDEGDPKAAQVHFDPSIHFDDPGLLRALYAGGKQGELIHEFLTLLSICHTVIPEVDSKTREVVYRASSPDEEALVKAAKCLGYNFVSPAPLMKVEISRKPSLLPTANSNSNQPLETVTKSYTIVNVNEFNSTRKRMSVVAINNETREYVLYCKGADNMMLERAVSGKNDNDAVINGKLVGHLRNYAREGLRTLVLGRRVLTAEEYKRYNEAYVAASTALEDREAKLDACAEMIEKNMQLLGVTAIEDKLQEGVPSAIFDLAQAGMKVWVLTGDREETAINIGHACRLINDTMQLLYVNAERVEALSAQLDALYETPEIQRLIRGNVVADNLAMVCDGKALVHIFPSRDARAKMSTDAIERVEVLTGKLLEIARKAEIVQLVRKGGRQGCEKKGEQPITLAIGDGANDVSMIQTAHVGVGICGKEGVQAENASDYAIAQFRFLTRLVLLHGRCNYKRICKVIRYSFYKNIALVISLFIFNFFNGQSGAPLFESFVMAGWNFFLALPIIVIGVFDQDISEDVVLRFPQLYRRGQHNSDLNMRVFSRTILNSVAHALICFYGCYAGNRHTNYGLYVIGTLFYTILLGTMNLKVSLLTLNWNKYHLVVMIFSTWLFIFFLLVYPQFTFMSYDMFGVPMFMIKLQRYWTLLLLCPVAAMLIDFTATAAQQQFRPRAEDILRERFRPSKSKRVSDIVTPLAQHGSPSVDKLFVAEQSADEDNRSDTKDVKPNTFVVTGQPPSPIRRSSSTNNLVKLDSFKGGLPQPQARTSFAFNGVEQPPGRHASGDQPVQEAVTMRVLSFQKQRQSSRSISLSRIPIAPELAVTTRQSRREAYG